MAKNKEKIDSHDIFHIIQKEGKISTKEMFNVFNMGIGMTIITDTEINETPDCYQIGEIITK